MGLRFGRYETIEPVASGGMARVYRGRALGEAGFERIVAIKVMHPHLAGDPEFIDMFLDEARLAARVQHPNVVPTYDVQRSPQGTFLVMDYIDGIDLALLGRALRARGQKLPIEIALRIMLDMLAGLGAAHALTGTNGTPLNLVHRDVSPQNILLDRLTGVSRLTDFGVAHAKERVSSTRTGELKGKLGYLSPEHARDSSVDARSDIYSSGIVLWEALTGRSMFGGQTRARVIADILAGTTPSPRELDPAVPDAISDACMQALRVEPNERYQTAGEFATALVEAARASDVVVGEYSALVQFLEDTDVKRLMNASRERLAEDELTLTQESIHGSDISSTTGRTERSKRAPVGLAVGIALALVAGVVIYPMLRTAPAPVEPAKTIALPPAATEAPPGAFTPAPDPALDPKTANAGSDVQRNVADAESLESRPEAPLETKRPRTPGRKREMYHPKEL